MEYNLLTTDAQIQLLRERIIELESDHFRQVLLLEEIEQDPAQAEIVRGRIVELERRIIRHVGVAPQQGPELGSPEDLALADNLRAERDFHEGHGHGHDEDTGQAVDHPELTAEHNGHDPAASPAQVASLDQSGEQAGG